MNLDDLSLIVDAASTSAFRLETLQQYLVPQEETRFAEWRAGVRRPPRTPETSEWIARLKRDADRGFRWYRVHILDHPLTEYMGFELWGLRDHHAVGAEVYLCDRDDHPDLALMHEDFWLFDDEIAIRMIYDEDGHFLRPERRPDPAPYRKIRDTALRHSVPIDEYLAGHPSLWSA